ncbi:DUF1801 domain-containing protein [Flavobacterium sp. CAU 1735]|uniref:DUF1801 domain-containing protein n=1 Tax=Flavobacterium sp. CAU 1735 TaxID=3140361 RepID=UPI003260EC6F
MTIESQIHTYISSLPEAKRSEMKALHQTILELQLTFQLWFLDGKNSEGKVVSNPNIGYGSQTMHTGGKTREFYKVGISANTSGISVYIMGIEDKTYLVRTYGEKLGKARISGYCIKFRKLEDINIDILEKVIRDRLEQE